MQMGGGQQGRGMGEAWACWGPSRLTDRGHGGGATRRRRRVSALWRQPPPMGAARCLCESQRHAVRHEHAHRLRQWAVIERLVARMVLPHGTTRWLASPTSLQPTCTASPYGRTSAPRSAPSPTRWRGLARGSARRPEQRFCGIAPGAAMGMNMSPSSSATRWNRCAASRWVHMRALQDKEEGALRRQGWQHGLLQSGAGPLNVEPPAIRWDPGTADQTAIAGNEAPVSRMAAMARLVLRRCEGQSRIRQVSGDGLQRRAMDGGSPWQADTPQEFLANPQAQDTVFNASSASLPKNTALLVPPRGSRAKVG